MSDRERTAEGDLELLETFLEEARYHREVLEAGKAGEVALRHAAHGLRGAAAIVVSACAGAVSDEAAVIVAAAGDLESGSLAAAEREMALARIGRALASLSGHAAEGRAAGAPVVDELADAWDPETTALLRGSSDRRPQSTSR